MHSSEMGDATFFRVGVTVTRDIENTHMLYRYLFRLNFTQTLLLFITVTSLFFPLLVTTLKYINFIK